MSCKYLIRSDRFAGVFCSFQPLSRPLLWENRSSFVGIETPDKVLLDIKRPSRDLIFFASLRGSKRCIGFTAENSGSVKAILSQRGLLQDAQPA